MTQQQQVAARLAQLRRMKSVAEHRDIRQPELAALCGVEPETYSRWENGKRGVPDEAIFALAKYYDVTPGFIRYGEPMQGTLTPEQVAAARAETAAKRGTRADGRADPPLGAAARKPPKRRRNG